MLPLKNTPYFFAIPRLTYQTVNKLVYRPALLIVHFCPEKGQLTTLYLSETDRFDLDEMFRRVQPDYEAQKDYVKFNYVLPYSVVPNYDADLLYITMNLRDEYNVVVCLEGVLTEIGTLIEKYKEQPIVVDLSIRKSMQKERHALK